MIKDKRKFKILVVEDNAGDVVLIEDYLVEKIIEPDIINVGSFKEAATVLSEKNNLFDVIFLDLTLPDEHLDHSDIDMPMDDDIKDLKGFDDDAQVSSDLDEDDDDF